MRSYSDRSFSFPDDEVQRTVIVRIEIDHVTGKQSRRMA
jgi:hypothetical protein